MNNLKDLVSMMQETVDKGVVSVEQVHREIANQPLDMLERVVPPDVPIRQIRAIQDQVIGTIYGMIRLVNKTVGDVANGLLVQQKKTRPARRKQQ